MPRPGEQLNPRRRLMAAVIRMTARKAWEGKVAEIEAAFESSLDVTVIRPPMIAEAVTGRLHVHETKLGGSFAGVGQVADFMVDQLTNREWIGKAPVVWSRKGSRGHGVQTRGE